MLLRSLLALPVATTMAGAQVPARDLEVFVDSVIKAEFAREKAPGAGLAFVQNGRVIMQRGNDSAARAGSATWT